MSNISDIVDVSINIEAPAADAASFGNMIIITPDPATAGSATMDGMIRITRADTLKAYGYETTDPVYIVASLAFSQNPRPSQIYVAGVDTGENSEETAASVLAAVNDGSWYGICLAGFTDSTDLTAVATWAEANEKLFGFTFTSNTAPIDISSLNRTFAVYGGSEVDGTTTAANEYASVALMAKCLGYVSGAETWALKTLNGIKPSALTDAQITAFDSGNITYYQTYGGVNVTLRGKVGSGEWIDIIRFRDWLKTQIQISVFNYLRENSKVAYNDSGITGVQNVILSVLKTGQENGGIDETRFDAEGNEEVAYSCSVPLASSISSSVKASRKLYGVTFVARLAGAIHAVAIEGSLVY